jgi:hypothetical protein
MTDWVAHYEGKEVREDLRLIDQLLWEKVREKFQNNKQFPGSIRHRSRWKNPKAHLPEHPFSGILECGVCASDFQLVGGKAGGYYGCSGAHKRGICTNRSLLHISSIESSLLKVLGEKLADSKVVPLACARYQKAIEAKLISAPKRLMAIETEIENIEAELKKSH